MNTRQSRKRRIEQSRLMTVRGPARRTGRGQEVETGHTTKTAEIGSQSVSAGGTPALIHRGSVMRSKYDEQSLKTRFRGRTVEGANLAVDSTADDREIEYSGHPFQITLLTKEKQCDIRNSYDSTERDAVNSKEFDPLQEGRRGVVEGGQGGNKEVVTQPQQADVVVTSEQPDSMGSSASPQVTSRFDMGPHPSQSVLQQQQQAYQQQQQQGQAVTSQPQPIPSQAYQTPDGQPQGFHPQTQAGFPPGYPSLYVMAQQPGPIMVQGQQQASYGASPVGQFQPYPTVQQQGFAAVPPKTGSPSGFRQGNPQEFASQQQQQQQQQPQQGPFPNQRFSGMQRIPHQVVPSTVANPYSKGGIYTSPGSQPGYQ
uniref:Uncharacterized protein n=1 Tax=Timema douglasi TaxID=61478 RepID=A0A7R8VWB8_TIMDO|nr:unnamed protein product [Timema douglasi]